MKIKYLQLRRAMSAALFVLLLSVAGTKNALAQNQVAALQHGDEITHVYYGQDAFYNAYVWATNGDIILLSSGTFNKFDIEKCVTVRGAGCVYDTITQVAPTVIPGEIILNAYYINFEGISFPGSIRSSGINNINFVKCNICTVMHRPNYGGNNMNWQFVDCIIQDFKTVGSVGVSPASYYYFHNLSIINSVVRFTQYEHTDVYNPNTFNNSIVLFDNGKPIKNIVANNSIIATVSGHTVSNCSFFNCIGIKTGTTSLFEGQTTQNVMVVNNYTDVFETFTGTVSFDNIYQLKEEIATSFLGNDGTEVGIYGGMMPYRTRPNYQIIKNCNVSSRTTEDNKLNVQIELLNAGE